MDFVALQHGHTGFVNLFSLIDIGHGDRTICHLIVLEDCLQVSNRGIPDGCLQLASGLCTCNLARAETFLVVLNCGNECHLSLLRIMVVQAIRVHPKVHLLAIGFVDGEDAILAVSIISHLEFIAD